MRLLKKVSTYVKLSVLSAFVIVIAVVIYGTAKHVSDRWDNHLYRGARFLPEPAFGDHFSKVYPSPDFNDWDAKETGKGKNWQGWAPSDSMWFYQTSQGSDLLPYDFFLHVEQKGSQKLFRNDKNMDRYRYIPQVKSYSNPDSLPIGLVKDRYKGRDYLGFTCAACHTSQINYNDVAIRIDGGPTMADMAGFMGDMEQSLHETKTDADKKRRFVANVLGEGNYSSKQQVLDDLDKYALELTLYNQINKPLETSYGYARLDAFGRIFNRVLKHVLTIEDLKEILAEAGIQDAKMMEVLENLEEGIVSDEKFSNIFERFSALLKRAYPHEWKEKLIALRERIFIEANAPVSYPFLWDTPRHDFVQWNGSAGNAGVGALGRNIGEVLGVFAKLDWTQEKPSFIGNLIAKLGGQINDDMQINYQTSIDLANLELFEKKLKSLESPVWPVEVLPEVDMGKAKKGKRIFTQYCQSCHSAIQRSSPLRKVTAQLESVNSVGTDPTVAKNSVEYKGWAGITRYQYTDTPAGSVVITQQQAPVSDLLRATVKSVLVTPDPDGSLVKGFLDRIYAVVLNYFDNPIKNSIRRGNHEPATTQNPYAPLMAYKARPLNGIWATAPYLHNGSVPTLYDLLLPKCQGGSTNSEEECRPIKFMVGSREFDPEKVGFKYTGYNGFQYDTAKPGNSNAGHEYAAGKTPQRDGKPLPPLNKPDRLNLLEYLKTL